MSKKSAEFFDAEIARVCPDNSYVSSGQTQERLRGTSWESLRRAGAQVVVRTHTRTHARTQTHGNQSTLHIVALRQAHWFSRLVYSGMNATILIASACLC